MLTNDHRGFRVCNLIGGQISFNFGKEDKQRTKKKHVCFTEELLLLPLLFFFFCFSRLSLCPLLLVVLVLLLMIKQK